MLSPTHVRSVLGVDVCGSRRSGPAEPAQVALLVRMPRLVSAWQGPDAGVDPVADGSGRMSKSLAALAMDALLLQGSDQALHHTVLLGKMGCDKLLTQSVAFETCCALLRCEDESVVAAKKELICPH